MHPHSWVAIVTLVSLLVYLWMALGVVGARKKSGINAPTMTGDPELERRIRVQSNTLEWLPIFLPSLWLFAIYWNDLIATILGVIWIFGRIIYALGYAAGAEKREVGFIIQGLATVILLFGALGRVIWMLVVIGA
jgi:glutathione S-transferase